MISRQTYEQMMGQLRELSQWMTSIGLSRKADRIHLHIANICRLMEAREKGRLRKLVGQVGQEQLLWSLVEAVEFIDAVTALRNVETEILSQKIRDALEGPVTPVSESAVSNLGRNTMFELNLAGRLHSRGISVQLLTNPDILCSIRGKHLHVHCKRPLTETKIPRNISDARKQLTRDISASQDDHARGVIAISLSRVLNPGNKLLVVQADTEIERELAREIQKIRERYIQAETRATEDRIVAFIYHLISPVLVNTLNLVVAAEETFFIPLPQANATDRDVLYELAARIS